MTTMEMAEALRIFSREEIGERLKAGDLPFSGITPLGSAEFHFHRPDSTLAVVLHSAGRVRPGLGKYLGVSRIERLREEDPYMERFAEDFPLRLIARDSRFEYDLNREIGKAIYPVNGLKWGLQVWRQPLPESEIGITLAKYREFHALLDLMIKWLLESHRHVILFDLHSYCYRREVDRAWWEDDLPEINLGTRSVNRSYFSAPVDLFLNTVSGIRMDGHLLRVGENQAFPGGYLTRKYAGTHNRQVLILAIEYKKVFMDERTGELYPEKLELLRKNLVVARDRVLQLPFG